MLVADRMSFFYLSVSPGKKGFFRITPSLFNSLYDPFGSSCRGQKPQERGRKPPYSVLYFFESLRLPLAKGSSTFSPSPSSSGSGDVTALRCSEPLRYKVGGPIKGLAMLCGMGPPGVEWEPHGGQLSLKTRLVLRNGRGRGSV